MASKTLTATVKINTKSAESSLNRLSKKINAVQSAINKTSRKGGLEQSVNRALIAQEKLKQATLKTQLAEEKLTTQKHKTALAAQQVKDATDKAANSTHRMSSFFKQSNTHASGLLTTVKRLAATYLGIMGMKAVVGVADTITSAQNKLNYVNAQNLGSSGMNADGSYAQATFDATQDSMNKMYASSQRVRMGYSEMMANVSKSMALAGDSFQNNTDNAIRFQEIMAEAYAVGGASAQEMSSSMYQMIQALGAGVLAGDELRSVREGAPLAYKAIEEFAQGVYDTEESLKELASQGKITSDMVVAAVMNAGTQMDAAFKQTNQTFAQTWTQVKNAAVQAFRPVIDMINEMHNAAIKNGLVQKVETFFANVAKAVMIVFTVIKNVIAWIADNWDWIRNLIIAAIILMIGYYVLMAAVSIYVTYQQIKAIILQNAALLTTYAIIAIIVMAVLGLLYVFLLWKSGAIDTCQAIVAALLIVAIAILLIGILTGNLVMVVIAGVILLVATIVQHLDYVLAFVYSLLTAIWNLFVGSVNAIIQFLWSHFVEPWIGIIEWVLNVFNGGFNSFGDAVKNLLGNIISWFLSLGQVVTKIIDAIFGSDWTSELAALKDNVLAWGKNETAITLSREAPEVLSRKSYTDAWNTGMEHGSIAKDWLNNLGSKFQTGSNFTLDSLGEKLGLDFSGFGNFPNANDPAYNIADAYQVPEDLLGDIKDDTGDIKDNMELTAEDLEYLRKIAEMEWKKEYTTAEIKVDMSNYNTIDSDSDLDGIVTKLTDKLYEELASVANGVYV